MHAEVQYVPQCLCNTGTHEPFESNNPIMMSPAFISEPRGNKCTTDRFLTFSYFLYLDSLSSHCDNGIGEANSRSEGTLSSESYLLQV